MPDCTCLGVNDIGGEEIDPRCPVHGTGRAKECRCVKIPPPSYHSEFAETVDMRACPIHGAKKYPTPPSQETKEESLLELSRNKELRELADIMSTVIPDQDQPPKDGGAMNMLLVRVWDWHTSKLQDHASTVADKARQEAFEEVRTMLKRRQKGTLRNSLLRAVLELSKKGKS